MHHATRWYLLMDDFGAPDGPRSLIAGVENRLDLVNKNLERSSGTCDYVLRFLLLRDQAAACFAGDLKRCDGVLELLDASVRSPAERHDGLCKGFRERRTL
jgi:hypothetical protein